MEDIYRANALTLAVEGNRSFDLLEFVLNQKVLLIAVCVVIGQRLQSPIFLALGDKPTRALGSEEDEEELEC